MWSLQAVAVGLGVSWLLGGPCLNWNWGGRSQLHHREGAQEGWGDAGRKFGGRRGHVCQVRPAWHLVPLPQTLGRWPCVTYQTPLLLARLSFSSRVYTAVPTAWNCFPGSHRACSLVWVRCPLPISPGLYSSPPNLRYFSLKHLCPPELYSTFVCVLLSLLPVSCELHRSRDFVLS